MSEDIIKYAVFFRNRRTEMGSGMFRESRGPYGWTLYDDRLLDTIDAARLKEMELLSENHDVSVIAIHIPRPCDFNTVLMS